jgi:hypothetical protein
MFELGGHLHAFSLYFSHLAQVADQMVASGIHWLDQMVASGIHHTDQMVAR